MSAVLQRIFSGFVGPDALIHVPLVKFDLLMIRCSSFTFTFAHGSNFNHINAYFVVSCYDTVSQLFARIAHFAIRVNIIKPFALKLLVENFRVTNRKDIFDTKE